MRHMTKEEFEEEFFIIKELSADKEEKTYLAMKEFSDGIPVTLVLKEISEKAADIYSHLCGMWNPYIAETYEIFTVTENEKTRHIAVTECVYAENSPDDEYMSLFDFVMQNGKLSEKTALSVSVQICRGLCDFHKKGFVHRDLKPENIMISKYDLQNPEIKIIDFGGAKHLDFYKNVDMTVIGTLGYQAPETISSKTTKHSDIYSIGCILNFMLTQKEPALCEYNKKYGIVKIIEKATNEDPSHRYGSVTDMQKEMEHMMKLRFSDKIPFINGLPGFRTHTFWKELSAGFCYIWLIYIFVFCINEFEWYGLPEVFLFYVIVPLILLFDMGNLLRIFPAKIRRNNRLFLTLRAFLMFSTVFAPIIVNYIRGDAV